MDAFYVDIYLEIWNSIIDAWLGNSKGIPNRFVELQAMNL